MAATNSKPATLANDLRNAHAPIYQIIAMLHGAEALLEKAESMPDPDGDVWHAAEIVRQTIAKAESMMEGFDEMRLVNRAEQIEGVTA